MTDAYHRGILQLSQVGAFAYVVPLVPDNDVILICINLILPMGWVDSPKFFCAFSETLTDVENDMVDADLPVLAYGRISMLPSTEPPPFQTPENLTHINCYMDEVISAIRGRPRTNGSVWTNRNALEWGCRPIEISGRPIETS